MAGSRQDLKAPREGGSSRHWLNGERSGLAANEARRLPPRRPRPCCHQLRSYSSRCLGLPGGCRAHPWPPWRQRSVRTSKPCVLKTGHILHAPTCSSHPPLGVSRALFFEFIIRNFILLFYLSTSFSADTSKVIQARFCTLSNPQHPTGTGEILARQQPRSDGRHVELTTKTGLPSLAPAEDAKFAGGNSTPEDENEQERAANRVS